MSPLAAYLLVGLAVAELMMRGSDTGRLKTGAAVFVFYTVCFLGWPLIAWLALLYLVRSR